MNTQGDRVGLIWSIAELLRHDYKPSDYGKVILPFTLLRRLDCWLAPTKAKVLERAKAVPQGIAEHLRDLMLFEVTGQKAYNVSPYDFAKLAADPDNLAANLKLYVNGFPETIKSLFAEHFEFFAQIDRLEKTNLLLLVLQRFASVDLAPAKVPNEEMGLVFEELIRRFAEQSNETAGEHFTPREVIRLMVDLLFNEDLSELKEPGKIIEVYDPACGTGGMLAVAEAYLKELNPQGALIGYGQEINGETFAICTADMLVKGGDPTRIVKGNSFTEDGFADRTFDYMLSNGIPDPKEFAADLGALIEHLQLADVRLIAQSMGGWTSLEYLLSNPDHKVRALVLASTCGTIRRPSVPLAEPERLADWTRKAAAARADMARRGISPPAGERMAREQPMHHFLYRAIANASAAFDREQLRTRLTAMATRPPDVLRGLSIPSLFIVGGEDTTYPFFLSEVLAGLMPTAKADLVPESGHSVYFQRAETFNQLVDRFLARAG